MDGSISSLVALERIMKSQKVREAQASGKFITEQSQNEFRSSKLVGLNVYGTDNQKIGDINEILLDKTGDAKAGVIGFAKALAQENANKGVTVNVIAPGYIATEMVKAVPEEVLKSKILPLIPVGRLGEAEEIARTVLFLAADDAGFVTGSTLSVNGGQYMA